MQKHSYSLDTGNGCVAAGLATGIEGCTAAPGIGMPAGGHTGLGNKPVHMYRKTHQHYGTGMFIYPLKDN